MRRVKPAHLARVVLYGSLGLGLFIALYPPQGQSRQPGMAEFTPDPALRPTHQANLERYLASLPAPGPPQALTALRALDSAALTRLISWLASPAEQRPSALFDAGLPQDSPLFPALLATSFAGINSPSLSLLPDLLFRLPLAREDPLRLRLFQACAARAAVEKKAVPHLQFLSEAARHPTAAWPEMVTFIEAAQTARDTAIAIPLLHDWLDDPPAPGDQSQITAVRRALARFQIEAGQLPAAWAAVQPLLDSADTRNADSLDPETLDLAWTIARLQSDIPPILIDAIESFLRPHPQQRLNWRELADAPPPSPAYMLWLGRLAQACLQCGRESRAVELHLHLALLDSPLRLLPALPAAARLQRIPEVVDLLSRLEMQAAPPLLTVAEACLDQQDVASARLLLELHLRQNPGDLHATRLMLLVKTSGISPLQAATLWRRHLQSHPDDLPAQHQLVAAWLRAAQPQAALNHLLATDPARLDPALRLQSVALALENLQRRPFVTALERLLAAADPVPAGSLPLWLARAESLGEVELARSLSRMAP